MKTMNSIRKAGHVMLAVVMLAAFTQVSSSAQSMASAEPNKTITVPAGLQVIVYQVPETTRFKVHVLNNSGQPVMVRLRNAGNQLLYSEKVTDKNYSRKFDLEKLTDGAYQFEITNGDQQVVKEVTLQTVTARNVQVQ